MSDTFREFFCEVIPIKLMEPLAGVLGALKEDDAVLEYRYADAVKLAGHACPTVTGAALHAGFKGLWNKFKRKDLLEFDAEKPDPGALSFRFERGNTRKSVLVHFYPQRIPFPQEKSNRMKELLEKVIWEAATGEEQREFQDLWMERVKLMIVDRKDLNKWLIMEQGGYS